MSDKGRVENLIVGTQARAAVLDAMAGDGQFFVVTIDAEGSAVLARSPATQELIELVLSMTGEMVLGFNLDRGEK